MSWLSDLSTDDIFKGLGALAVPGSLGVGMVAGPEDQKHKAQQLGLGLASTALAYPMLAGAGAGAAGGAGGLTGTLGQVGQGIGLAQQLGGMAQGMQPHSGGGIGQPGPQQPPMAATSMHQWDQAPPPVPNYFDQMGPSNQIGQYLGRR